MKGHLKQMIHDISMQDWDQIPDFGVYSDQLLTIINESEFIKNDDQLMTSSMINNYVKQGIVEKPRKKKYNREQIACLMMIALMKSVLTIKEIQTVISKIEQHIELESFYRVFSESIKTKGMYARNDSIKDLVITESCIVLINSVVKAIYAKHDLDVNLKLLCNEG